MRYEGKVALVTGAASGIGRAAAIGFAREGAKVMVADVNEAGGEETVCHIQDLGGAAIFARTDVTSAADVAAMVDKTVRAFGRLDAAFNNAGTSGRHTDVVNCTQEEWDFVLAANLSSVWLCMKHEIPAMAANGGGAIVNCASQAAENPSVAMASYVATKAGVVGLTRSAALDFASSNIRVNAILPGPTVTPMLRSSNTEVYTKRLPLARVGAPEDQAAAVLWLCSSESSFVTGVSVQVDGGRNLL
jgi:NAD(P)-dependent dehydrogenase (short-subunit alcohol dehydrogenase family)